MVKVCQICRREFEANGNRAAYCPECKPKHIAEQGAIRKKKSRAKKRSERGTKKLVVSIAEQNRKAREKGMTYGQYVAKYGEVEK